MEEKMEEYATVENGSFYRDLKHMDEIITERAIRNGLIKLGASCEGCDYKNDEKDLYAPNACWLKKVSAKQRCQSYNISGIEKCSHCTSHNPEKHYCLVNCTQYTDCGCAFFKPTN